MRWASNGQCTHSKGHCECHVKESNRGESWMGNFYDVSLDGPSCCSGTWVDKAATSTGAAAGAKSFLRGGPPPSRGGADPTERCEDKKTKHACGLGCLEPAHTIPWALPQQCASYHAPGTCT